MLSYFTIAILGAQEKVIKVSQVFNVDNEVIIDLTTTHCNIIFDTWNKNEVSIEAYIESDVLTKAELEEVSNAWHVDVDGSRNLISIETMPINNLDLLNLNKKKYYYCNNLDSEELEKVIKNMKYELADLPEMNFDFDFEDIHVVPAPKFPKMPEMPELPELPEGICSAAFDYEAYKKEGDAYLEKWSKTFESKYGEEYAKKMEDWGEKFGEAWGEKYAKQIEKWSKKFGKDMEKWSEEFGEEWGKNYAEQMEEWGERYAAEIERYAERTAAQQEKQAKLAAKIAEKSAEINERVAKLAKQQAKKNGITKDEFKTKNNASHLKKTIIIKMPKKAKVKADVRHGALEFASVLNDVQADLSHTTFKAQGINGSNTSINAAYAPVYVSNWNLGELNLNHVNEAQLKTVKHLVLNCNSSNVKINNVVSSAIIDSNIGDIKILKVDDTFTNLNFILQNNKAYVVLPNTTYNINYKGKHSYLVHPDNGNDTNCSSFSVSHSESNKTVTINAKYSKVIME